MGCGISKIDPEEATGRLKRSHYHKRNIIGHKNTVVDEADYDFVSSDDHHNGPRKSVSCNLPVIEAINNGGGGGGSNGVVEETDNVKRDDYNEDGHAKDSSFCHGEDIAACPASPSFREYCTVDSGSSYDENDAKDENGSQGERVHAAAQENSLNSDGKAHESRSPERHTKSTRKGFRSAIHKPAGWIGRSRKQ